ncbi:MAG: hypothetical protein AAF614_23120 [Chloroflexota bacterium]
MTRIVGTAVSLDALTLPNEAIFLRIAPDEAYIYPPTAVELDDEWAIVKQDSGLAGVWIAADMMADLLEHLCEWEVPTVRPVLCQGMIAGLPTKLWFEEDRCLLLVPSSLAAEMEARIA